MDRDLDDVIADLIPVMERGFARFLDCFTDKEEEDEQEQSEENAESGQG